MARGNARSSAGGRISGGKPPYSPSPSVQGCAPAARMRIASAGGCCSECSRAQLPVRQRQLPCDRSAAGARQRGWRGSRAGGGREARLLAEAVTAQQLAATERSPGRWVQLLPPRVRGHWSTDIHRGCDGLGPCGRVSSVSASSIKIDKHKNFPFEPFEISGKLAPGKPRRTDCAQASADCHVDSPRRPTTPGASTPGASGPCMCAFRSGASACACARR